MNTNTQAPVGLSSYPEEPVKHYSWARVALVIIAVATVVWLVSALLGGTW